MSLCKYKNIIGMPRTGIHSLRDPFFDIAINDVAVVAVAAYIINMYFTNYSFWYILIIIFIIGILSHRLFCVRTTIDKFLFPYLNE